MSWAGENGLQSVWHKLEHSYLLWSLCLSLTVYYVCHVNFIVAILACALSPRHTHRHTLFWLIFSSHCRNNILNLAVKLSFGTCVCIATVDAGISVKSITVIIIEAPKSLKDAFHYSLPSIFFPAGPLPQRLVGLWRLWICTRSHPVVFVSVVTSSFPAAVVKVAAAQTSRHCNGWRTKSIPSLGDFLWMCRKDHARGTNMRCDLNPEARGRDSSVCVGKRVFCF